LPSDSVPDAFTTAAIADLDAILARIDGHGEHGLAAIHIQWAIELLRGEKKTDPREAGEGPWAPKDDA
jgi:hypothetical protein